VNLADAISPDHAVTLRQEQAWAESTLNQSTLATNRAAAALASQNAAKTSEINSKTSESAALVSKNAAKTSETNSKASEVVAKTSETNSKASEVAAKTSETNSKASAVAAKTSETNAASWAASVGLPSASGKANQVLMQNGSATGLVYRRSHYAFGLGGLNKTLPSGYDLNDLRESGLYMGPAMLNRPNSGQLWAYVLHQEHGGAGYSTQMAFSLNTGPYRVWGRNLTGGLWSAWVEMYHTGNLEARLAPIESAIGSINSTTPRFSTKLLWSGVAGTGTLLTLNDDAWKYEGFSGLYAGGAHHTHLLGLRELCALPAQTQMYVNAAPNYYILCKFEDTGTSRRLLRIVAFGANSGFTNLYGYHRIP
jgi:hypothetical protein